MLNKKSILITGATGSFGKRFIQRITSRYSPRKVIVYSRDELKQFEMAKVFKESEFPSLRFFLGDVRDRDRLKRAFTDVDIVIHAAALKHVTAAEYNPFEFIKTNVIGAQNIIETAIDCGVEKVVALSTDKASNPINVYGATKLCSDKLFVAASSYAGKQNTKFSVVRYGNVVGSRGSVIPFFLSIRDRGEIPITDPRMTRFWITLDQGIDLVLMALEKMQGGEIFVPKIPSMRITDLAEAIAPNCKTVVTGIRPGEKLHECMIGEDDALFTREYDSHYVIQPAIHDLYKDKVRVNGGRSVPEGFRYSSESNDKWLSSAELLKLLSQYRLAGAELIKIDDAPRDPAAPIEPNAFES